MLLPSLISSLFLVNVRLINTYIQSQTTIFEKEKKVKNEASAEALGDQNIFDKTDKTYAFFNSVYFLLFDETFAKKNPIIKE